MAAYSETYYLQLYKDALTKPENVEQLIELLKSTRVLYNPTLLASLEVVTSSEWREIDESSKSGSLGGKNERRAKMLIEKVLSKSHLKAYRGFRKFIAKQTAPDQMEIIARVFPFGSKEDKAGLAPQIVHKGAHQHLVVQTGGQSTTPTILWITLGQSEYDSAKKSLTSLNYQTERVPSQCNLVVEKATLRLSNDSFHDVTLFLTYPRAELSGPDPFKQILTDFTPRPHLALLTGPCSPLPGSELSPDSSGGNVHAVVVMSKTPMPIEGEVQYQTELLKLKGRLKEVCVSFGGAARMMDPYEGCTIYFPKAILFYAAAQAIEGLEYLTIAQVCREGGALADSYNLYVCNVLQSISEFLSS